MSNTPDVSEKTDELAAVRSNRRRFLAQAGLAGVGALTAGKLTMPAANAQAQALANGGGNKIETFLGPRNRQGNSTPGQRIPVQDTDILNFALNLEYLEAEFYLRAAFGTGLSGNDIGGTELAGDVSGGSAVPFQDTAIREYAEEIARDEEAHVRLLRSALGTKAVARPAINLSTSFTAAARAAGVIGPNDTFNPFENDNNFLLGAFIFEDVGVTAYKGAAPLIKSSGILSAAAGLLAVEAYHAGEIRTILSARGLGGPAGQISDLRDFLDEDGDKDQGIVGPFPPAPESTTNIVPTDANGLAFDRTPLEVLKIVYFGRNLSEANANGFGFFPNGLNGRIR
ncbi:MAG TPA: ferritin-like domain-containing protein [Abditibacteriaceae bacterium]|jgi:hypothetical protein